MFPSSLKRQQNEKACGNVEYPDYRLNILGEKEKRVAGIRSPNKSSSIGSSPLTLVDLPVRPVRNNGVLPVFPIFKNLSGCSKSGLLEMSRLSEAPAFLRQTTSSQLRLQIRNQDGAVTIQKQQPSAINNSPVLRVENVHKPSTSGNLAGSKPRRSSFSYPTLSSSPYRNSCGFAAQSHCVEPATSENVSTVMSLPASKNTTTSRKLSKPLPIARRADVSPASTLDSCFSTTIESKANHYRPSKRSKSLSSPSCNSSVNQPTSSVRPRSNSPVHSRNSSARSLTLADNRNTTRPVFNHDHVTTSKNACSDDNNSVVPLKATDSLPRPEQQQHAALLHEVQEHPPSVFEDNESSNKKKSRSEQRETWTDQEIGQHAECRVDAVHHIDLQSTRKMLEAFPFDSPRSRESGGGTFKKNVATDESNLALFNKLERGNVIIDAAMRAQRHLLTEDAKIENPGGRDAHLQNTPETIDANVAHCYSSERFDREMKIVVDELGNQLNIVINNLKNKSCGGDRQQLVLVEEQEILKIQNVLAPVWNSIIMSAINFFIIPGVNEILKTTIRNILQENLATGVGEACNQDLGTASNVDLVTSRSSVCARHDTFENDVDDDVCRQKSNRSNSLSKQQQQQQSDLVNTSVKQPTDGENVKVEFNLEMVLLNEKLDCALNSITELRSNVSQLSANINDLSSNIDHLKQLHHQQSVGQFWRVDQGGSSILRTPPRDRVAVVSNRSNLISGAALLLNGRQQQGSRRERSGGRYAQWDIGGETPCSWALSDSMGLSESRTSCGTACVLLPSQNNPITCSTSIRNPVISSLRSNDNNNLVVLAAANLEESRSSCQPIRTNQDLDQQRRCSQKLESLLLESSNGNRQQSDITVDVGSIFNEDRYRTLLAYDDCSRRNGNNNDNRAPCSQSTELCPSRRLKFYDVDVNSEKLCGLNSNVYSPRQSSRIDDLDESIIDLSGNNQSDQVVAQHDQIKRLPILATIPVDDSRSSSVDLEISSMEISRGLGTIPEVDSSQGSETSGPPRTRQQIFQSSHTSCDSLKFCKDSSDDNLDSLPFNNICNNGVSVKHSHDDNLDSSITVDLSCNNTRRVAVVQ